ncbi:hypothetical protein OPT61_g3548 [Boeremia exigua]|uniref:Uncharacterized protein n=1 Tax=Boeremia exigua TaxID=749465 RepID=A0ACC2IHL2_9PLEO|nr:hypothetical protein OPT61_g3548 [Boeremia exigua]
MEASFHRGGRAERAKKKADKRAKIDARKAKRQRNKAERDAQKALQLPQIGKQKALQPTQPKKKQKRSGAAAQSGAVDSLGGIQHPILEPHSCLGPLIDYHLVLEIMCRIDERAYVGHDGHESVFEENMLCERGRQRGKMCANARVRRTVYHHPNNSPIPTAPHTPSSKTLTDNRHVNRKSTSNGPSPENESASQSDPEVRTETGSRRRPAILEMNEKSRQSASGVSRRVYNPAAERPRQSSVSSRTARPMSYGREPNYNWTPPAIPLPYHPPNQAPSQVHGPPPSRSAWGIAPAYHPHTNPPFIPPYPPQGPPAAFLQAQASRNPPPPIYHTNSSLSFMELRQQPRSSYGFPQKYDFESESESESDSEDDPKPEPQRPLRRVSLRHAKATPDLPMSETRHPQATVIREPQSPRPYNAFDPHHAPITRPSLGTPVKSKSVYDTEQGRVIVEAPRLSRRQKTFTEHRRARQEYHDASRPKRSSKVYNNSGAVGYDYKRDYHDDDQEVELVARAPRPVKLGQVEAEDYISLQRGRRETLADQSYKIAKRRSSRTSTASSEPESSDDGELVPIENGMNELVISGNRKSGNRKSAYHSERGSIRGNRKALVPASHARRDMNEFNNRESSYKDQSNMQATENLLWEYESSTELSSATKDSTRGRTSPELLVEAGESRLKGFPDVSAEPTEDGTITGKQTGPGSVSTEYDIQADPITDSNVPVIVQVGLEGHNQDDQDSDLEPVAENYGHLPRASTEASWHVEDDSVSTGSTYAASIFSVKSLASDATDLSQSSGYSPKQIATATKVLIDMLQDENLLVPLYKCAMANTAIGPERLERNLYKLFKYFARDLGEEYGERLEYLASRLVALRARYLAKSIVEKYRPKSLPQLSLLEPQDSGEDSSEDELGATSVADKDFDDLHMFRQFLVKSKAFTTLCVGIETFVLPKTSTIADIYPADLVKFSKTAKRVSEASSLCNTWRIWREDFTQTIDTVFQRRDLGLATKMAAQLISDGLVLATDKIFIATGLLEPLLAPSSTRLRWTCECGDRLFSDVVELQANGVKDLIALMEASSRIRVVATPYRNNSSNQQYTGSRHLRWFGSGSRLCSQNNQPPTQPSPTQPSPSTASTNTSTTQQDGTTEDALLHLMACVDDEGADKILLQDRIQNITTDRALIQFLRNQYRRHRSRLRSFLSLRCVQGIHFVKFYLPLGDSVIIIPHDTTCAPTGLSTCECLPPRDRVEPPATAEYKCRPVPPKTFPPIPPEYLLSFFTCRKQPHEASRWMVEQFPKRSRGELFGGAEQPAEGWGIYYKEGWDPKMIARFVLGLLLVSMVFGVVWTVEKADIQGAFGVASWIVGVGGALLAVLVTSVNSL